MSAFIFDDHGTNRRPMPRLAARASAPLVYRSMLMIACATAIAGASVLGQQQALTQPDAELTFLLRGMALIKAALVLPALAALWWRFGRPVPQTFSAGYITAAAVLCGATMLIWQLAFMGAAAVAFHGAGLALLVLALKDGDALSGKILRRQRAR